MARQRRMRIASVSGVLAISTFLGQFSPRGMVLYNFAKTGKYPQAGRK